MNQIRCELCNEDYDASLIRFYRYINPLASSREIVRYFICEDCVIDHKKYGWKLGEEIILKELPDEDIKEYADFN